MTSMGPLQQRCAVCRTRSEFTVLLSTNSFGSPDLDTRPSGMARSTLAYGVLRCPQCGYCAADITARNTFAKDVVGSAEYREQLSNPLYPDLANSFICSSIVSAASGDFAGAAWSLIHGAWVCDDSSPEDRATSCRNRAVDMVRTAEEKGVDITPQVGVSTAILVDLLRRAGRLDDARREILKKREAVSDETILRMLDFQRKLIDEGDRSCHAIAEALD